MGNFKETKEGLEAAKGFRAAAVKCGVRYKNRLDLALFYSDTPCAVSAFFTRNRVNGAHIPLCRKKLAKTGDVAQALLVNSGIANCSIGPVGLKDAVALTAATAKALGIPADMALMASTGVIGVPLPVERIAAALPALAKGLKRSDGAAAARAIMTTDTVPKTISVRVDSPTGTYHITGVAKGAGMISPSLATQFAFLFTDADVADITFRSITRRCVEDSFNCIAVDGDMSPNDTVLFFANGASGVKIARRGLGVKLFEEAMLHACRALAVAIVRDGEGATKLIDITVQGAATSGDARLAARAVGLSPLVKTAVFGNDPNWGRIVTALGYSGAVFDPEQLLVELNGKAVFDNGHSAGIPTGIMKGKDTKIVVDLRNGRASAHFWTCDFSTDYVKINAEYTT